MIDSQLFLGFPVTKDFLCQLDQIPSPLKNAFISHQSCDYLQQIENNGQIYLGKPLGSIIPTSCLDSLELHIYSLLKKLIPDHPYKTHPLSLLTLPNALLHKSPLSHREH